MEGLLGRSKKAFDKVPGKKRVEKEINRRIQELPALLNLPSQREIDSIVRRVKNLHTKVEALKKETVRSAMTVEETLPSPLLRWKLRIQPKPLKANYCGYI